MEIIWFGSQSNLAKLSNTDCSVQVGSSQTQPSTVVRDLGLHLDSELSMKQHIAKVAATCFYHIRRLRQIRRRVDTEVTIRLVLAVDMSTFIRQKAETQQNYTCTPPHTHTL